MSQLRLLALRSPHRPWVRRLTTYALAIAGAYCFNLATAFADPPDFLQQIKDQTAAVLGGLVKEGRSSFSAALYVADGRVAFETTYGKEAPTSDAPFSMDSTLIDLNSIIKIFTAVAIAQLVENGSIKSIDDPVNRYLTHFKLPPAYGHDVTIRELATHSAGLDLAAFGPGDLEAKPADFFAQRFPGYFENPQHLSAYDSYGPKLLAYMVSEITGRSYPRYVKEAIAEPLGMDHTFFVLQSAPLEHRLLAYQTGARSNTAGGPAQKNEDAAILAGTSVSSMHDLAKLIAALLGPADGQHVITQPMRDLMFQILQSNGDGGAAHGLFFDAFHTRDGRTLFVHGAVGPGIDCLMALDTPRKVSLFYCYGDVRTRFDNNSAYSPPTFQEVADAMLVPFTKCELQDVNKCPAFPAPQWKESWKEYLGLYVDYARHHHGFSRLRTLLHPSILRISRSGQSLKLGDHDGFVEVSPGAFASPNYSETFSLVRSPETGKLSLSTSDRPSAFERPGVFENPLIVRDCLAILMLLAASGAVIVAIPRYGINARARGAVASYMLVIGVGIVALVGFRAFGARYLDGNSAPLVVIRLCAFLTIPTCAMVLASTYQAHKLRLVGIARLGRAHLDVVAVSSVLLVVLLLAIDLISFDRIT